MLREATKSLLEKYGALDRARAYKNAIQYPLKNTLHVGRELAYRLPNPMLSVSLERSTPADIRPLVQTLRRDGIVTLPGLIQGDMLKSMQERFEQMISSLRSQPMSEEKALPPPWELTNYREQGYDPQLETTYTYQPFRYDFDLLKSALDGRILSVCARYFGKSFLMQQSVASRYYPTKPRDFASWQWHHDGWGKRINVMLLLTNVTEADQYMSYAKGSHRIVHSLARTLNSRFTNEEVAAHGEYPHVQCVGEAGTAFVFDPNGYHRGNRSLGAHRDTLITSYNCGRYVWSFDIPRSFYNQLNEEQQVFLRLNPHIKIVD